VLLSAQRPDTLELDEPAAAASVMPLEGLSSSRARAPARAQRNRESACFADPAGGWRSFGGVRRLVRAVFAGLHLDGIGQRCRNPAIGRSVLGRHARPPHAASEADVCWPRTFARRSSTSSFGADRAVISRAVVVARAHLRCAKATKALRGAAGARAARGSGRFVAVGDPTERLPQPGRRAVCGRRGVAETSTS
jgi:hypothetical protein